MISVSVLSFIIESKNEPTKENESKKQECECCNSLVHGI